MNDDRFEQDLRSLLSRAAPAEVPAGFREEVIGTPYRRPRVTWRAPRRLFASGLVAASVIAAVVLVGVGISQLSPAATQPTPSGGKPTSTPSATAAQVLLPVSNRVGAHYPEVPTPTKVDAGVTACFRSASLCAFGTARTFRSTPSSVHVVLNAQRATSSC